MEVCKACLCLLVIFCSLLCLAATLTTRGVALTKLPFYDSSKDFTCLDGSLTIPFSGVNDDYCDCKDGTDEPGTAACSNGQFHCTNAGFKPKNYPASRVNDGICDCCDGSDEYDGKVSCSDNCKELYKQEYEKRRQEIELAKQGYAKKHDLIQEGKGKKEERQRKLEELKLQLEQKNQIIEELKANKERVEAIEKEAKDKEDKEWEEMKAKIMAQRDHDNAIAAFKLLDADSDGSLMIVELLQNQFLDKDYSEEEAKEMLGGSDSVDESGFVAVWGTFKDKFKPKKEEQPADVPGEQPPEATPTEVPPTEAPVVEPPTPPPIDESIDDDTELPEVDNDDDEDDGDDLRDAAAKRAAKNIQDTTEPVKPEYDEDTKAKIADADHARKEFDGADSSKRDIEREIGDIETMLNIQFGEHEEYAPLYGQCFEMRDREYVYKLCPFDKATQEPKDGGASTSIGNWGEWNGNPNKFSSMKYTGGQGCWNGPDRSTHVIISCGTDNEIMSVSEPSRCEYQMEFRTPAACADHNTLVHQEL